MPPEAHAACVCAMEDTLAGSQRPSDERRSRVCCDAGPTPWVKEVRAPIPAAPGRLERSDDEDERHGTGHLCMRFEPLAGRCAVLVTARRTAVDDAEAMRHVVEVRDPRAATLVLVPDTLHAHTRASLYEACPPEEARRLIDKLEGHSTPTHGSWLTMAEIALGVWRRQCLDRRIPDFTTVQGEVAAWQGGRNAVPVQVNWQLTSADARVKLKRLYPTLDPVKTK